MTTEVYRVRQRDAGWEVERLSTQKRTLFREQRAAERYAEQAARFKAPSQVTLQRADGSERLLAKYLA